jgi:hypothetical protein
VSGRLWWLAAHSRRGFFGASEDKFDGPLWVRQISNRRGHFLADKSVATLMEGSNCQFNPRVIRVVVQRHLTPWTPMRPAEELPENRE